MSEVVLHVGCRKSGTSYLQASMVQSREALRDQGVAMPLGPRRGHVRRLLWPLERALEGDGGPGARAVADLSEAITRAGLPRALVTLEDLAELPADVVTLLVQGLAPHRVTVLITARSWASVLPSEWQQCVKERLTVAYDDYLDAVRGRSDDPEVARFLARQDVPAIADRWAAEVGRDRVLVLPVPSRSAGEGRLEELFCSVLGVDPTRLTTPRVELNPSLGLAQAEALRLVNVALGDRLADFRGEYRHAVRDWITRGSLRRQQGDPITIPERAREWCRTESERQVAALGSRGYGVVGDPGDLVGAGRPGEGGAVDDAEVARAAARALADLAVARWEQGPGGGASGGPDAPAADAGTADPEPARARVARRVLQRLPDGVRGRLLALRARLLRARAARG